MYFYSPQTKFAKVMFLHLSVSHSVHGGGGVWQGACMAGEGVCMAGGVCGGGGMWGGGMCGQGGMHGQGACMAGGMHGRGVCVAEGGMHGREGGMCGSGACMHRGVCVAGGVHAPPHPPDTTRYGQSMHGRYASYWNAFLLNIDLLNRMLFGSDSSW